MDYVGAIVEWYNQNMNYGTITALMTIESSFIPFPSEVVVPPAAAAVAKAASNGEVANLNIYLIVIFATLGAILGALINYGLSILLGRPIIYSFADSKVGRLCLLSSEKIKKAEDYFNEHGKVSTFVCRLIPGIRQLISIPAGLARMNIGAFIGYTALGAGIWNCVLAALGYFIGDNIELVSKYSHEVGYSLLGVVLVVIAFLIIKKYRKARESSK